MSDEPEAIEPTAPWVMPEPVFRTTEGVTPRSGRRPMDPSPDDDMHLHDTLINEELSTGSDDAQETPSAAVATADGGWARGSVYVAVLLGLIAAAIIAAAFYYYFDLKPKP